MRTAPRSTPSTARGSRRSTPGVPLELSIRALVLAGGPRPGRSTPGTSGVLHLSSSPYADGSIEGYIYVHIYTYIYIYIHIYTYIYMYTSTSMHTRVGTPSTECISGGLRCTLGAYRRMHACVVPSAGGAPYLAAG